jgi:hypothetical protein
MAFAEFHVLGGESDYLLILDKNKFDEWKFELENLCTGERKSFLKVHLLE